MTRTPLSILFVLEMIGAAIGFLLTVPASILMITAQPADSYLPQSVIVVAYLLAGAALWVAAAISRIRPALALTISWGAAIMQVATGLAPSFANIAIFVVLFATAAWGSKRLMWIGGASAVVGGIIAGGYIGLLSSGSMLQDALTMVRTLTVSGFFMVMAVLALLMGWGAGLLWRLVLQSRRTREAQVRAEEAAVAEQERVRIARDMHDVVAHSLAVVIAQADGARYAAASDPEAATEALSTIAHISRSALTDVRLLLTQLRHSQAAGPQPTLADLEELFAHVRRGGIDPQVTIDPMPPGEPPAAIQLAVYRILQEALTNALRHGDGDVSVHLAWWPQHVEVTVRNAAAAPTGAPGGHGIIGMRERAQLVGGTLIARAEDGGFVVHANLPVGGTL